MWIKSISLSAFFFSGSLSLFNLLSRLKPSSLSGSSGRAALMRYVCTAAVPLADGRADDHPQAARNMGIMTDAGNGLTRKIRNILL